MKNPQAANRPQPLGPAPVEAPPAGMSLARAGVLTELRRLASEAEAGVGVGELAEATGLHPNTAREHLDALVAGGLAVRERGPAAGRGRPPWRYHPRPDAAPAEGRVREYAGLASALAAHIARTSADPSGDAARAGAEWGADLVAGRPAASNPAAARREVVGLLTDLGFDPQTDAAATTARLRRCPLLDVARQHPDVVCAVHLGIVRGALQRLGGTPARTDLVPFAEPGACRLHLLTRR